MSILASIGAGILAAGVLAYNFGTPELELEDIEKKYSLPNSKFVFINNVRIHYVDEGLLQGPVLVLVHGSFSSLHTWNGWSKELKNKFRIIRMDLPGFGLSGPSVGHDYSYKYYVSFLDNFLTQIDVNKFILAGNSLGGRIAWSYSLRFPSKVTHLILVDPAGVPQLPPWIFMLSIIPLLRRLIQYVAPKILIRQNIREVFGDEKKITEELITRYFELTHKRGNRESLLHFMTHHVWYGTVHRFAVRKIKDIQCPTLIQWGGKDRWISVTQAHYYHKTIPNSQLIIYEGVGHTPMEEIPELSAKDLNKFILLSLPRSKL